MEPEGDHPLVRTVGLEPQIWTKTSTNMAFKEKHFQQMERKHQRYSAELKLRNNMIYHYPCQVWLLIFLFPFVGLYCLFLSRKVIKYQPMFEWKAKLLTLKLYRTLILGYFMALTVSGLIIGLILCTDCKSLFQQ